MTVSETFRITLPRAIDIGNDQLAARAFELNLFTNTGSEYTSTRLNYIAYAPAQIPVQVWHIRGGGTEIEQVMGANGRIPISVELDELTTARLIMYNLSMLSECHFTFYFDGNLRYGRVRNVPWN